MSRCIVHVGMHKTGSSSIQVSLARHLADPAFHYLDFGEPNASRAISTAFRADPETYHINRRLGLDREALREEAARIRATLARELQQAGSRTAILSGEDICLLAPPELRALQRVLEVAGREPRIVAYVREPVSFMESAFQQRVKGGLATLEMTPLYPRYQARFRKLERVFGPTRVEYWHYAPASFPSGCVVMDFCTRLGIAFDPASVVRSNQSLSLPALRLLYIYRRHGPAPQPGQEGRRRDRRFVRLLSRIEGPRLRFHADMVARILEASAEDRRWMEERLGVPLEGAGSSATDAVRGDADLLHCDERGRAWLRERLARLPGTAPEPDWDDPAQLAAALHRLQAAMPRGAAGGRGAARRRRA